MTYFQYSVVVDKRRSTIVICLQVTMLGSSLIEFFISTFYSIARLVSLIKMMTRVPDFILIGTQTHRDSLLKQKLAIQYFQSVNENVANRCMFSEILG